MNPTSGSLTLASNVTGGLVEVTCTAPSGVAADDLIGMMIKRVLHRNQALQELAGARGTADAIASVSIPGTSVTGSGQQRSIKFSMTQATCNDAGMYICDVTYYTDGSFFATATNRKNLSVTVDPGPVTMTADPQQTVYNYNSSLLLRCNGPIEWMWEYKEQGGFIWTTVTTTDDSFNEESSTPSGPGNCAQNQVVTLQRYVLPEDTGRTYRCYVRRVTGPGGNFEQHAGEYTIGTVLAPEIPGDAQQSGISMNPASGSLTLASNVTGGLVEVTCTAPSGVAADDLIGMMIKRVLHRNQALQELAGARGTADATVSVNIPGTSVTGSGQQRSIKFSMTQATCSDAGMYICDVTYYTDGSFFATATSGKNLSVTVDPGPVTMTADPQQAVYNYSSSLLLRCNGPIEWMWEYKEQGGFIWTTVTTTDDSFNEESSTPSGPGNCAQNQVVTLQRYVLPEDTGRTYRCYVRRVTGSGGNFDQYAGEYTIGTVLAPEIPGLLQDWNNERQKSVPLRQQPPKMNMFLGATGPYYELRQAEIGLTSPHAQASTTETAGATGPYYELRQNEIGLTSPYAELNPYEEPMAKRSTCQN
ncbi:hypothetical protein BaRGS_00039278 [Batillaria attramentaria]|uniref:Ig-like domain-containing protein n=1 Tax=Batillaria attramentaria TaxID=370345 RepID=A0ABD0J3Q4_9CAEN